MSRIEELAGYLEKSPLLAEGIVELPEESWLRLAKDVRMVLTHRLNNHRSEMKRLSAPVSPSSPVKIALGKAAAKKRKARRAA